MNYFSRLRWSDPLRAFSTSYTGNGVNCIAQSSGYSTCPAAGGTDVPIPNTSWQGVMIYDVRCDGRGYSLWCISHSHFGKRVFDTGKDGWVGKRPYTCGQNSEDRWDLDADGLIDELIHAVTDADCGSYHDGDGDGLLDSMVHTYVYAPNLVTSCNRERNYTTNALVNERCKPSQVPYSDPAMVPGSVP